MARAELGELGGRGKCAIRRAVAAAGVRVGMKIAPGGGARGVGVVSERTARNVLTEACPTRAASGTESRSVATAAGRDETAEAHECADARSGDEIALDDEVVVAVVAAGGRGAGDEDAEEDVALVVDGGV